MFQTELILFLQSFSNDVLTFIFQLFSDIGHTTIIMPIIVAVTIGFHFRIGVIMMHTTLWTGVATVLLKEYFSLPRPSNVDSAVQFLERNPHPPTPFESMGAKSFFESLPQTVVDALRAKKIDTFGLPSGHTSTAVSVWGSVLLYFKTWPVAMYRQNLSERGAVENKLKWIMAIAITFIICIPLSRMYLGRHFLGDVLGGFLVGSVILLTFYHGVYRNDPLKVY
ncbi:MAG: phosphatase PAP2 family protein, partial [bacterium]|nr:phosphatase PAP2 family protein [bacterium]